MAPINDEFENALAWFAAAPAQWLASGKKNIAACAEWVWEVLQGDFNENQTTDDGHLPNTLPDGMATRHTASTSGRLRTPDSRV